MKFYDFYSRGEIVFLLIIFISIYSCSTPHYMYAPTAANAPAFTEKNESSASVSLSSRGFDMQAGYAVSNHIALSGSWYWRHERQFNSHATTLLSSARENDSLRYRRELWSLGLTYFTPMDERQRSFFMLTGGYGSGHISMKEHSEIRRMNTDTLLSVNSYTYRARMNRVYLQPAIMGRYSSLKVILSLRFSGIFYDHIHSTYAAGKFNLAENKLYVFSEPALTLRITPPRSGWLSLIFQAGFALPPGNADFRYRSFIGNVGIGLDPVKLLRKKDTGKETPATL